MGLLTKELERRQSVGDFAADGHLRKIAFAFA
jgi:hypothetical protein